MGHRALVNALVVAGGDDSGCRKIFRIVLGSDCYVKKTATGEGRTARAVFSVG